MVIMTYQTLSLKDREEDRAEVQFSFYLLLRVGIVIYDIEVDFMFGLPDYAHYIGEFVISRFVISTFYSIHFTVTLSGAQNIIHYIEDFVK